MTHLNANNLTRVRDALSRLGQIEEHTGLVVEMSPDPPGIVLIDARNGHEVVEVYYARHEAPRAPEVELLDGPRGEYRVRSVRCDL